MFMKKTGTGQNPMSSLVMANLFTAIFCLGPMMAVTSEPSRQFWEHLFWAALLGIGPLGLGYVFYLVAIKRVTALEAGLIPAIETILNPVWTFLVIGEVPGFWTFIGGFLILTSVVLKGFSVASKTPP
jgi:drug/metabolite transporter (DMT)-like permease